MNFKYDLDQTIWYMMEGHICSAPILARTCVENLHNDWCSTPEQSRVFLPFGESATIYGTCHGIIYEPLCFSTKELLVESLLEESK